ncbi:MAG: ribonuclease T [Shewanella psychromarinicola]|jgi:ribonuclease T|uniref:Ribonuclease T n=1 Tax=Shewanella psychromarinicola TaxID=2487742 RepID=A0A3N4DAV5_9GAMM|nr:MULTISPECIES: ribonuclease T [Shewanella]AZG35828.1 ribonuclease T [Shewanella psychromarinicola]MCL1083661.1 ribonuclease T [Shewanella psychromarinicola]PKG77133.1 ribonuclease T [Shewanella sp. Actino-trap-3]RPA22829.1 ribonuclease T [Shewanella psychromarinicola]|tara:strand:- start:25403 stop:26068 length:666 start_codon:yes stop_codon:yes gene_type:complete
MTDICDANKFKHRFRGYFPVVIDVETAGFNANTDALLEIAVSLLKMNSDGVIELDKTLHFHIEPFEGANLEPESLAFNGIDPTNPLRGAVDEKVALLEIFKEVKKAQKAVDCHRSIIVAHNAAFDLGFVNKAIERNGLKRSPFHPFASFDTATLAGLAIGHTVLAKACKMAGIDFDNKEAHSALYDTERTAELFCLIVNRWKALGGWPLAAVEEKSDPASE